MMQEALHFDVGHPGEAEMMAMVVPPPHPDRPGNLPWPEGRDPRELMGQMPHPDGRIFDPQVWLARLRRGPYHDGGMMRALIPYLQPSGRHSHRKSRDHASGGAAVLPITVQVGCAGAEERFELAEDATVGDLKDEISLRTSIPVFAQKVLAGHCILENDEVLLRQAHPDFKEADSQCKSDLPASSSTSDPEEGSERGELPSTPQSELRFQVCRLCSEHDANWLAALQAGKHVLVCRLPRYLWSNEWVPEQFQDEPLARSVAATRTVQAVQEATRRQRDLEDRVRDALVGTGFPADLLSNECFIWMSVQMPFDVVSWLPYMFLAAPAALQEDRHIAMAAVRSNPYTLAFLSAKLRADRGIVLEAVSRCGCVLYFAPTVLYGDKEILLSAVKDCGMALQLASPELQADLEVVLLAVQDCGLALQFAAKDLQSRVDVVTKAVHQSGLALQHAGPELRADKRVVLQAVKQDGHALQYAADSLRKDIEVVLVAVEDCQDAFRHASPTLQKALQQDRSVVLEALAISACAYEYTTEALQEDREIFLAAVLKQCSIEMSYAEHQGSYEAVAQRIGAEGWMELCLARKALREAWQGQRAFGLAAVKRCTSPAYSSAYKQLAVHVREDKEVALAAVQANGMLFLQVPYRLRCDFDIIGAALQQKRELVYYIEPTLRKRALRTLEPTNGEDDIGETWPPAMLVGGGEAWPSCIPDVVAAT